MAAPTHDCPGGCGQQVRQEHFACEADWLRLPRHMRQAISMGHAVDPLSQQHTQAMADALEWYETKGQQ